MNGIHQSCGFGHFLIHHGTAPPIDIHYDKIFGLTNQKPSFNIYEARNDIYVNVENELENDFGSLFDDVIQKNLEERFYHYNFSLPKLIEAAILGNNPKVPYIKVKNCQLVKSKVGSRRFKMDSALGFPQPDRPILISRRFTFEDRPYRTLLDGPYTFERNFPLWAESHHLFRD